MTVRRAWLVAAALVAMALIGPACTEADLEMPHRQVNASYSDPKVMPVVTIDPTRLQQLPLCSQLADGLRGRQATIFLVADSGGLDAIDLERHIVCVDAPESIDEIGIISVEAMEPLECDFCDGTPLPAAVPPMTSSISN